MLIPDNSTGNKHIHAVFALPVNSIDYQIDIKKSSQSLLYKLKIKGWNLS